MAKRHFHNLLQGVGNAGNLKGHQAEGCGKYAHCLIWLLHLIVLLMLMIIVVYVYHALINALSAHVIHINLNMIFYTHVEHSPTSTVYLKY